MYTPRAYPKFKRGSMDGLPSESTNGMRAIGESVRGARWRAGLTQRNLGKLCGLDQSVISRLENGKLANLRWWRFAAGRRARRCLGSSVTTPARRLVVMRTPSSACVFDAGKLHRARG